MKRRTFMNQMSSGAAGAAGALGAGALGAGLAACGTSNAGGTGTKPTFVFVHGAWHGGWCWSETVRLLAEQGFPAIALDLPGHGITAKFPIAYSAVPQNLAALATEVSPLAALTINDYRDAVLKTIRGLTKDGSGPIILVGHSLGGATLSLVAEAEPKLIRKLVYLSAFVPVKLDSVLGYLTRADFSASEVPPIFAGDPAVIASVRLNHNASDPAYVAKSKSAFYGDVSDLVFAAVANLLTPDEPIGAFAGKVVPTLSGWGSVPRAFIRCTQDRAIPLLGQDNMIAEADAFTPTNKFVQKTLATSHSPFVSNPQALVTTLLELL
jgi:pimeloyl-ACP methyl ester carboxylesterase